LRGSFTRRIQPVVFDVPGPQPLAKDFLIHGDVLSHPPMGDVVETAGDVPFEHPGGRIGLGQGIECSGEGIGAATAFPEPVGVRVGRGFRHRCQGQLV